MENKNVIINNQTTSYFELAISCLKSNATRGITIGQMRDQIKIIDLLEDSQNAIVRDISLTPSQLSIIIKSVEEMQWAVMDRNLVDFYDYIQGLK